MKKTLLTGLVAISILGYAHASVSISLDTGVLYGDSLSSPLADGALIQLIVSTTDSTFSAPTVGSFADGDDFVLATFSMDSTISEVPGVNSALISDFTYSGSINAGDALMLRWFPTLSASSTASTVIGGTIYGQFTSIVPVGDSAAWFLPSDGATIGLQFLTESISGANADTLGLASFSVAVPEPATYAAILGFVTLGFVSYRRFRRR